MTQTRLDETLAQCRAISEPADVHLTHELLIRAAPAAVWEGLTRLRLPDLPLGRLFTAVRYLSLHPIAADRPLLTAGPLPLLHYDPPVLAVAAGASQPWLLKPRRHTCGSLAAWSTFEEPHWAKILLAFEIEARGRSLTLLRSETLVWCTDPTARRRFTTYWTLVKPFAVLLRREMLQATARLALQP